MFFVALGLILLTCGASGNQPPSHLNPYFYYYFDTLSERHLRAMTRELLKDVEYKMRYAAYIFASYGGQITPEADKIYSEVGYLQSSLMKKFRYMCSVYRHHSKVDEYISEKFNVDDMLNANHLLQSAYHELLVLKDLQNIALDKQEALQKKERAMQFFMEFKMKEKTAKPKTRSRGSRQPAVNPRAVDLRRVGVDLKKTEQKLKEELKSKKWIEGKGINESMQWKQLSEDLHGLDADFRK